MENVTNMDSRLKNYNIKKLGLINSSVIYFSAATLMFTLTKYLIPYLCKVTGLESIFFWFIVAGLGIFTPLIITGLLMLKAEGNPLSMKVWKERLRFGKLSAADVLWSLAGLIAVGIFSVVIMKGMEAIIGKFDHSPTFMTFEPLTKGRYWLLLVWLPYWFLNIMGEEFFWRGVMLPQQELAFGKYTWIIHGLGWLVFHIAFGWHLLITLAPLIFIQSYIVQKRKNSWIGVLIHGGLNGPSFIAISFGLI